MRSLWNASGGNVTMCRNHSSLCFSPECLDNTHFLEQVFDHFSLSFWYDVFALGPLEFSMIMCEIFSSILSTQFFELTCWHWSTDCNKGSKKRWHWLDCPIIINIWLWISYSIDARWDGIESGLYRMKRMSRTITSRVSRQQFKNLNRFPRYSVW